MKLSIRHTLTFSLGTPARAIEHLLLTPTNTAQQKVERWSIDMPGFTEAAAFRDGYGNKAHLVNQIKPEGEIVVTVSGEVETTDKAGVLGRLEYDPMPAMFRRPTALTKPDEALLEGLSEAGGRIAMLHALMGRLSERGSGQSQSAEGQSQTQGEAADPVELVHAFIGAARALDVPARYVTGYLFVDGAGTFHPWAEAWDEGLGWIGFDPSCNLCPADTHVRLACGLDAMGTVPIRSVPVWGEMPAETVEITAA